MYMHRYLEFLNNLESLGKGVVKAGRNSIIKDRTSKEHKSLLNYDL